MTDDGAAFRNAVRRGYDALAADYDAVRDDADPPAVLVDALADTAGGRLLDAGCGGGRGVLGPLGDSFDGVGLDISRAQLELAGERAPAAARVQGDMTRLPFAEDAFDAVTALHSVIHVPAAQHTDVYREFRRVLRDGGVAVVTAGTEAWEGENDDWLDSGEHMQWSFPAPEETEAALADAGFRIEDSEMKGSDAGGSWRFYRLS
ncbi:class I SAM-dependent methyltransferase [Halobacterium sp. R2-5]|uniref:class I SAM-dependent methyltransferase n=1 Tax=Halobacterium sp. R2-5 TaxID=2715751 RepID=UPI00141E2EBD|nr:class I SAM-dependent methyltransferase [Halobacterium sp. R2-5]NIB98800.1 methyltransferase domain-containing protein [Halobacterium sp. R2-5]